MPHLCVSCGEPTGGSITAVFRCRIESDGSGDPHEEYVDLRFPQCPSCHRTQLAWITSVVLGQAGGLVLIVGLLWFYMLRGVAGIANNPPGLIGAALCAVGTLGLGIYVAEIWELVARPERRVRLERTFSAVSMHADGHGEIDFEFGDEEFAEAFAELNPDQPRLISVPG
jgi:hypothetical protein